MDFKENVKTYLKELAAKDFTAKFEDDPVQIAKNYVDNVFVRIRNNLNQDAEWMSKNPTEKINEIYSRIRKGLAQTVKGLYNIKINGVYIASKIEKMPRTTKEAFYKGVRKFIAEEIKGGYFSNHKQTKHQKETNELNTKIRTGIEKEGLE